eukprot:c13234_g1_i1.p1 GENE.c13234_g1_i1~~c13234_g1_i1.p1  ORF type:complete len:127 (+),score=24.16 c13234_g1_i1:155-535(+)
MVRFTTFYFSFILVLTGYGIAQSLESENINCSWADDLDCTSGNSTNNCPNGHICESKCCTYTNICSAKFAQGWACESASQCTTVTSTEPYICIGGFCCVPSSSNIISLSPLCSLFILLITILFIQK